MIQRGIVEKLVFGGAGLIRKDGLVIFVPDVIPGEEVLFEIVSQKKNFAHARLLEIVHKSPHRIQPRCRHFGTCGGCQLQHIAYDAHAEIKKKWLEEAFFRLFDKNIEFFSTDETFCWRRKITLHAQRNEGKWILGYFGLDNKTLLEIEECPLFFQDLAPLLFLKTLMKLIPGEAGSRLDVELFKLPDATLAIRIQAPFSLPRQSRDQLLGLLRTSIFKRRALQFGSWAYSEGDFFEPIQFSALGKPYYFSLQAFVQNHAIQGEKLWHDVVDIVDRIQEKQTVFDLYAGVGVTAIALANLGHNVTAIEGNKDAILCAEKTCSHNVHKPIFICSSVEKAIPKINKKATIWLLNPPRTGISKKALELTSSKAPEHIIYISCSPATLARDVKEFIRGGWSLDSLRGYDMFPQTTHLETIAELSRSGQCTSSP
jgi:23S rRNA (uracil1939-C5)-methyltransferase